MGVMTFTDMGLQGSTQYNYEVLAMSGPTSSMPSSQATSTTMQAPNAASALTATILTASQVQLSWTSNSPNATGFKIARSTDGVHFGTIATAGANATTYVDSGLTGSTTYYYLVIATNSIGDASPSNMVNVKPQIYTLDANGFATFTPTADTQIIYVSSSQGNNTNNGLSPNTAVQTLARAQAMATYGHPVWILPQGRGYFCWFFDMGLFWNICTGVFSSWKLWHRSASGDRFGYGRRC